MLAGPHLITLLSLGTVLALGHPQRARSYVLGGGPRKTDCYAAWQVTAPSLAPAHGSKEIDCEDGDPRCDADGSANGICTMGVSICAHEGEDAHCQAPEVT